MKISCALVKFFVHCVSVSSKLILVSNDVSAGNKLKSTDDDEELAALELTPKISYTSS